MTRSSAVLASAWLCAWLCTGALALGLLGGCGDDDATGPPAASRPDANAERPDGSPETDGSAETDGAAVGCLTRAADDSRAIALELPREPRPGTPFVLAITVAGSWSGDASVCLDGREAAVVHVYRGRGSATLAAPRAGPIALAVRAGASSVARMLQASERPLRRLTGVLAGDDLRWGADADVQLSADARVLAGERLVVAAGTRVLLGANAALEIEGELDVLGEAEDPVSFTRAGSEPWGGLRVLPGGVARLAHAWLGAGGGDPSRVHGHSDSQPVVWADTATVVIDGGGIVDNPGKALGSSRSRLTVRAALISRCDTGGELDSSALTMEGAHVLELPDADGVFDDDDNDGIYLVGVLTDAAGELVPSIIRDSVFAAGEDDAIDHNDAEVRLERVWIEGFRHEGLAASAGHSATIVDSVVRDCGQGIEAGYGSPRVEVDHCLLTGNDVGLRFGDSYDRATSGTLTVRNTISHGNVSANARNHVNALDGPLAGALIITCSSVDDPGYDGSDGNLAGAPDLDLSAGCATGPHTAPPECDGTVPGPRKCYR